MSRTILEIVQDAAPRMGVAKPTALYSETTQTEVELQSIANEVAERILKSHDWSVMRVLAENVGDGTTAAFSLPTDYIRMIKDAQVWSTRWQRPLVAIDPEEALRLDIRSYDLIAGAWSIYGGQIQFRPALASGESAKWYYLSDLVVSPASGSNKARFTDDTDTFRLDDRVFELTLIWEWRQQKGLDYAEDLATAEIALSQEISADGGARILTQSSRRNMRGNPSYPWNITP